MSQKQIIATLSAFTGALCFGGTLPAFKLSYESFSPIATASGRGFIAGIIVLTIVLLFKTPLPPKTSWRQLMLSSFCLVIGFPYLMALATQANGAATMGVFLSIAPLISAAFAVLIYKEVTSVLFWLCGAVAIFILTSFFGVSGSSASMTILAAVLCSGVGYAVCAKAAQQVGYWQAIAWCLVIALPVNAFIFGYSTNTPTEHPAPVSLTAVLALFYLAIFSQLIGFIFWNYGLATGGIATMVQFQHLVPFLSIALAALLAGESIEGYVWQHAIAVVSVLILALNANRLTKNGLQWLRKNNLALTNK